MERPAPLELIRFGPEHFGLLAGWFGSDREVVQWGGIHLYHPLDEAQMQRFIDEARSDPPRRHVWMARDGGALVGHIQLGLQRDSRSGLLGRVAVAPEHRGRGLGPRLVSAALDAAWREHWLDHVELRVYTFNAPALATYRRLGFRQTVVELSQREVDGVRWEVATMVLDRPRRLVRRPPPRASSPA